MSQVLVVSPHPDDESVGCGGALRGHVVEGDTVRILFLTSGELGGHGRSPQETMKLREDEAHAAAEILGIEQIEFWRQPDGSLAINEALLQRMRDTLNEFHADIIYVTHDREMHKDHQAAAELVRMVACGSTPPAKRPTVRSFEVWTPLQDFDHIVDISEHIETKMAAIRAYKSQCDVMRFDEAALGLSRYRGELYSWPEGDYAEVFKEMIL